MSRNSFATVYGEYTKAYAEKNFEKCLDVFTRIDVKGNYFKNTEAVSFLLKSVLYCLQTSKSSNTKYNIAIANGWLNALSEASHCSDYENFLSLLSYFTPTLEKYVPMFTGLPTSEFDLSKWLQNISKYLFQVLNNAKIVDDSAHTKRKEIYLQLTQTLLLFVNAEANQANLSNGRWEFTESRRFLNACQQFSLFEKGESIEQYKRSFDLLDNLLVALSSEAGDGRLGTAMDTFLVKLKSLTNSNILRATLTQDNYITLAKILKAYTQRFIKTVDSKNVTGYFNLIGKIAHAVKQMKSDKAFCADCDGIGYHCTHELAMLATDIYSKLIVGQIDDGIIEKFASIMQYDFEAVSQLKCAKAQSAQLDTVAKFRNLVKKCESKEKAKYIIPAMKSVLKRYNRFKLMDEVKSFDEVYILYYLFNVIKTTGNMEEIINVGYLFMAFYSSATNHPANFDTVAWEVAKKQKDTKSTITPFDRLNKPAKESLYGLTLPSNFDIHKLSQNFLKVGFKYSVLSPELSNKIIHQIFMSTSTKDPTPLRCVLSVQSMTFDKVTSERVDKLVNSLSGKSEQDLSIALQLAAIKYLRLNYEGTQLQDKYNLLSITEALTEAQISSETSIFREITLDLEKNHIETLRYVKQNFIQFSEFYIKQTDDERKKFEDEKELLLRELKVLANLFVVRGYTEDALELYIALYKLSKATGDEFGLIDACSFFAENRTDSMKKLKEENLIMKTIIAESYTAIQKKLKDLINLSTRKQNQVFFCLLNLVIFYYEDGENENQREIRLILAYVYKLIDDGDKNMEVAVEGLIGTANKKPNANNDTKKSLSDGIRIKFYSVLFSVITKYGGKSAFHPSKFIQFVMNHVKTHLSVYYDASAAIPILLFNMIPQMVLWLENHYEASLEIPALILTLLKLSLKSGYAHRTVSLMTVSLQMDLLSEKLKTCKLKLAALENVMLTEISTVTDYSENKKLENAVPYIDHAGNLCAEPIRKQATFPSPTKSLTPKQTVSSPRGNVTTEIIKFLPKHRTGCSCGICFSPQNKLLTFYVAVLYARYAYLNEDDFDVTVKRAVFAELVAHWEKIREEKPRSIPKSDLYYIVCARMLLYHGHFLWKYEKDYKKAEEQLCKGLKGLERVKRGAEAMKIDFEYQVEMMKYDVKLKKLTREQRFGGLNFMSRRKKFEDQTSPDPQPKKNQLLVPTFGAQSTAKCTPKPRLNPLDMVNDNELPAIFNNFQIHDDGAAAAADPAITPIVKRSTRGQRNKVDETPVRKASNGTDEGIPKICVRPNRVAKVNPASTVAIDLPLPKRITKRNPVTVQIDLTTPPETNGEGSAKLIPETPLTSKPPPYTRPKKPKCSSNKDAIHANETYQPKK